MQFKNVSKPTVYGSVSAHPELGTLAFVKLGGSSLEPRPGISHLCEHLVCQAWDDFDDYLTQRSISSNASTGVLAVSYYFHGLDRFMPDILENVLLRSGDKNIHTYMPSEAKFLKERDVIIQEYEGYLSHPYIALFENLRRRSFAKPGAIGNLEIIKETTYTQFQEIFAEQQKFDAFVYYGAEHARIHEIFDAALPIEPRILATSVHPYKPFCEYSGTKIEYFGKSTQQTIIGDWLLLDDSVEPWEITMLSLLFDDGFRSPLMEELRHKTGLAYTAQCFNLALDIPVFVSNVSVHPDNVDRARKILRDVYVNWDRFITPERFSTVHEGLVIAAELRDAKNYVPDYACERPLLKHVQMTHANVEKFTYARACEILSKFFTADNIRLAEVGEEIKL